MRYMCVITHVVVLTALCSPWVPLFGARTKHAANESVSNVTGSKKNVPQQLQGITKPVGTTYTVPMSKAFTAEQRNTYAAVAGIEVALALKNVRLYKKYKGFFKWVNGLQSDAALGVPVNKVAAECAHLEGQKLIKEISKRRR